MQTIKNKKIKNKTYIKIVNKKVLANLSKLFFNLTFNCAKSTQTIFPLYLYFYLFKARFILFANLFFLFVNYLIFNYLFFYLI